MKFKPVGPNRKNSAVLYIAILSAMIFWSFSFVWFKLANRTFSPITIIFIRLLISVILLFIFLIITRSIGKIRKKDRKLFFILSLFEPFLYFLGESHGLTYVSATLCSVIISTIPVFATIGAWLLFREKLRVINYAGILLSFIGVLVFILNKGGNLSFDIRGLALLLLAVFSAVGFNLTLNHLVGKYSPVFIVFTQNLIGVILFLPLFLIFDLEKFINTRITFRAFVPVIELSVFASCFAFILFAYSVRKMGITRANVFTNIIPVLTAIFSFLLLGEQLTLQNITGIFIVIAGLYMSQINGSKKGMDEAYVLTGKTA